MPKNIVKVFVEMRAFSQFAADESFRQIRQCNCKRRQMEKDGLLLPAWYRVLDAFEVVLQVAQGEQANIIQGDVFMVQDVPKSGDLRFGFFQKGKDDQVDYF